MRFVSLVIENMFAYGGAPAEVRLSDCTPARNIVVVSGPNGAGKTSLLNAVKLLFLGPNSEELRRVGLAGAPLSAKQYVLGVEGRWYGVFNTGADKGSTARVSLEWLDGDRTVRATRWFRRVRGANDFETAVEVNIGGEMVVGDAAETFLQGLLPRDVVRFFFFDGEQIQSLADAEVGRERAEIERLLGLSFVVELLNQLNEYQKERGRAGIPAGIRKLIVTAENAAREAEADAEVANRARVALEEGIMDLDRRKRRLEDDARQLRGGTLSESERKRILSRIAVLESQRETLAERIAEAIPPESMLLTQPDLVADAFALLDKHTASSMDPSLAKRLYLELTNHLIERLASLRPAVLLDSMQQSTFADGVDASLKEIGVPVEGGNHSLLGSLSTREAASLRDRFLVWSEKGRFQAGDHRDMLIEMRQVAGELQRLRRELDEAELTSDEAKARHEEILSEIEAVNRETRASVEQVAEKRVEEQRAIREAAMHWRNAQEREQEHAHVKVQNNRYRLGIEMIRVLDEYRVRRRAEIRKSVELRLNERVGVLLGPSQLVKSVKLDDNFGMTYFDEWQDQVARHSISAGMRQLIAMAMLWALKDEAERPLPVIVDTPLGRIDRTNRELLMEEYFPHAGNPLVLLPTDTEFGDAGYDAIGHRIRRRYRIVNEGGMKARIVEQPIPGAS